MQLASLKPLPPVKIVIVDNQVWVVEKSPKKNRGDNKKIVPPQFAEEK